jgi:hypothetical protein
MLPLLLLLLLLLPAGPSPSPREDDDEEEEEGGKEGEGTEGKRGVSSETVRFQSSWPVKASTARRDCSTLPNHNNCLLPPPPLLLLLLLLLDDEEEEEEGTGEGEGVAVGVTVGAGVCERGSIMCAIFSALGPENLCTTTPVFRSTINASETRAPV